MPEKPEKLPKILHVLISPPFLLKVKNQEFTRVIRFTDLSLPCLVFGHVFVQTYFPRISTLALELKALSLLLWIRIQDQAAENYPSLESDNVLSARQLDVGSSD